MDLPVIGSLCPQFLGSVLRYACHWRPRARVSALSLATSASVLACALASLAMARLRRPADSSVLTWASASAIMTCSRCAIWLSWRARYLSVGMVFGLLGEAA